MAERPATNERIERAEELLALLQARATGGSIVSTQTQTTFVFRPGATGTLPTNVYATQAPMDAAIAATSGPVTVEIDDRIVSPVILAAPTVPWRPAGVRDITIQGVDGDNTQLTHSGTTSGIFFWQNFFAIRLTGGAAAVVLAAAELQFFRFYNVVFPSLSHTFFDATAAGCEAQINTDWFGVSASQTFITVAAGSDTIFTLNAVATLAANTVAGPAGSFFVQLGPQAILSPAQSGVTGGNIAPTLGNASKLGSNRFTKVAAVQAGVASPAGQIVGGAVSTNAPFAQITIASIVTQAGGKYRVHGGLEVTTSQAAVITLTITARPTAGGGNFVLQYTSPQVTAGAAGAFSVPFDVIFDGQAGGFAKLPTDAVGSTDIGVQVATSAGTITTVAGHGAFIAEETGA